MTDPRSAAVRAAVPDDADVVAAICEEGYRRSSAGLVPASIVDERARTFYARTRVASDIAGAGPWSGYLVVEEDRLVLGAVGGLLTRPRSEVVVLYLRWDQRGRGLGRLLLESLTARHRDAGAQEQRVTVTEGNDHALPFYAAAGFAPAGREPYVRTPTGAVSVWSLRMHRRLVPTDRGPARSRPSLA